MKLEYKLNIDDHKYIQTIEKGKKYRIEIPNGIDVYGNKKRRVERVTGSFDYALKRRNEILEEIANGDSNVNKTMTLSELCDAFLIGNKPVYIYQDGKYVLEKGLSYASLKTYKTYINNYIKVAAGDIKICDITSDYLKNMYIALKNNYVTKKGKKLSPCTMGHIHSNVKAILQYAVKKEILKNNPAKNVENPPTVKCPEKECYSLEQLKMILGDSIEISKFVGNHEFYKKRFKAFIRVAIYGCLRRSEMSGLNWDDVIEKDCALRIGRSASNVTGKGLVVLETKTDSSEDITVVGHDTIKALLEYKKEIELIYGEEKTQCGQPIFISQNGNRLSPQAFNDIWNNYIETKKDCLPQYTLHTLRHSGGTLFYYTNDKDLKSTQKHLRHASIETTANTYLHSDVEKQKELVQIMEQTLTNESIQTDTTKIIEMISNVPKELLEEFVKRFMKDFSIVA